MIAVTRRMMETAKEYDLTLGVETEASNVVCTIDRTAKYLEEIGDDHLKVIMDCANLFQAGKAHKDNVIPTIDYAFRKLGDKIILAHGKDIQEGDGIAFCGAGKGIVDYDHYFSLLKKIGYHDGMIIHGLHSDDDFAVAVPLLKKKAEEAGL